MSVQKFYPHPRDIRSDSECGDANFLNVYSSFLLRTFIFLDLFQWWPIGVPHYWHKTIKALIASSWSCGFCLLNGKI